MSRHARPSQQGGFTIIEITIVMGLLSVFMVFLLQIVFTTTDVFESGQRAQQLAARGLAARRPVEKALAAMIGPTRDSKTAASDARLLVQWAPVGFVDSSVNSEQQAPARVQVIRSTVRVDRQRETALLKSSFQEAAEQALGLGADPEELVEMITQMVQKAGVKGRAEMLLLAWPEGDDEGAYFDLRRGFFLPGQLMVDRYFGADGFQAARVKAETEIIATGILHLSYRFASQLTRNWMDAPSAGGPELAWDSSRMGWLSEAEDNDLAENFSLDIGAPSAKNSTDDVYPHYVEVTLVVGMSSQDLPASQLAYPVGATDRNIQLNNIERLPDPIPGNFVKIGSEWVRFSDLVGNELRGVRRGQRGTRARSHEANTGVRVGKTDTLMLAVPHARDSWNG